MFIERKECQVKVKYSIKATLELGAEGPITEQIFFKIKPPKPKKNPNGTHEKVLKELKYHYCCILPGDSGQTRAIGRIAKEVY